MNNSLITDPTEIIIYLTIILAFIYWIKDQQFAKPVFKVIPFILWIYFLPMLSTTLGITPQASQAYNWITNYFLPASLVLLLISSDIPTIIKLGPKALITFLAGTAGIIIGAALSFLIFKPFLPADAWQGFAALSGSWIGGGANMISVKESIGTSDSMMGTIIIVDTFIGYGWMAVVIAFSGYQKKIDSRNNVDSSFISRINQKMELLSSHRKAIDLKSFSIMIALSLAIAAVCLELGKIIPPVGDILTSFGWTIILVLVISIILSFTKLQKLEEKGASVIGNYMLYFLLASVGAKANLSAIFDAPLFLAAGAVWIIVHAIVLYSVGRLIKAPVFLIATSSQANIGGVVSAPIVAGIYQPALAPAGLLLGVLGNIIGTFAGLISAQILFWIS
ncbi:MAG: DUF819 family protein [Ignavibacteriaceae bacterium]